MRPGGVCSRKTSSRTSRDFEWVKAPGGSRGCVVCWESPAAAAALRRTPLPRVCIPVWNGVNLKYTAERQHRIHTELCRGVFLYGH